MHKEAHIFLTLVHTRRLEVKPCTTLLFCCKASNVEEADSAAVAGSVAVADSGTPMEEAGVGAEVDSVLLADTREDRGGGGTKEAEDTKVEEEDTKEEAEGECAELCSCRLRTSGAKNCWFSREQE